MITLFYENPFTQETGSVFLKEDEEKNYVLVDGENQTYNFTLFTNVTSIIHLAIRSNSKITLLSKGPISKQEHCNVNIVTEKKETIPLGTISKEFPLVLGSSLVVFDTEVARSGGQFSTFKHTKYYGEIVAIDAR